jgi:hypothetical protein
MTAAALAISVLALMVSSGALAWQVVSYLLTGQRAKVSVARMNLLSIPDGAKMEPVVQITVSAVGRVPVEVTSWSISYPGEQHLHSAMVGLQYAKFSDVYLGDTLPMVVEPGRSASFNVPAAAIEAARDKLGHDPSVGRLAVHFAARRSIRIGNPIGDLVRLKPSAGGGQ